MPPDWDWILDELEDKPFGRFHLTVGLAAAIVVGAMAVGHLSHPEVFARIHQSSLLGAIVLFVIAVAPAFAAALALGQFVYPSVGGITADPKAPLSGYRRLEGEARKFRLRCAAGAAGTLNYLFLYSTAALDLTGY